MGQPLEIRPLGDEREVFALSAILAWAFGLTVADGPPWLARGGHDNVLVAVEDAEVVGGLLKIPMGQWFGGHSVPMVGIAGVCSAAHKRGRGVARALMRRALLDMAEGGVALSALYPATQPPYRSVGYEQAGSRFEYRVRAADLPRASHDLVLRRIEPDDLDAVREAYARHAAQRPGNLDRGEYIWDRVRSMRRDPAHGYLVERGGAIEGYLYVSQQRNEKNHYDLKLTDFVALTADAARALWGFVADQRSLGDDAIWHGGPNEAAGLLLSEQSCRVTLVDHWMLRLVNLPEALGRRGYAPGSSGVLELEVNDTLLEQNHGRFVLEVSDGVGAVRRGGGGKLCCSIGALASLYTGFTSGWAAAEVGLVSGDAASLAVASALFAGPPPCMADNF